MANVIQNLSISASLQALNMRVNISVNKIYLTDHKIEGSFSLVNQILIICSMKY